MNASRFNSIYRGLTATARNVYEAIPPEGNFTVQQINAALRILGHPIDLRIVGGCLASMVASGIIAELKTGHFCHVKVKEKSAKPVGLPEGAPVEVKIYLPADKGIETMTTQKPATTAHQQGAIARLSKLSERVTCIAAMLKTLASDIEKEAIEIDDQGAAREKETTKLKQLQQLLKELA